MIFGTTAPKFIFNPTGLNQTVLLNYVVILKDAPEEDFLIHQSIFTGHREFILKGKYWVFDLKMHLYKYTTVVDGKTPTEKYDEIKQFEGVNLRLYRHGNGDYLKDSSNAEVEMFLESVTESYYKTTDYKDLLLLKFKSTKYVDIAKGVI